MDVLEPQDVTLDSLEIGDLKNEKFQNALAQTSDRLPCLPPNISPSELRISLKTPTLFELLAVRNLKHMIDYVYEMLKTITPREDPPKLNVDPWLMIGRTHDFNRYIANGNINTSQYHLRGQFITPDSYDVMDLIAPALVDWSTQRPVSREQARYWEYSFYGSMYRVILIGAVLARVYLEPFCATDNRVRSSSSDDDATIASIAIGVGLFSPPSKDALDLKLPSKKLPERRLIVNGLIDKFSRNGLVEGTEEMVEALKKEDGFYGPSEAQPLLEKNEIKYLRQFPVYTVACDILQKGVLDWFQPDSFQMLAKYFETIFSSQEFRFRSGRESNWQPFDPNSHFWGCIRDASDILTRMIVNGEDKQRLRRQQFSEAYKSENSPSTGGERTIPRMVSVPVILPGIFQIEEISVPADLRKAKSCWLVARPLVSESRLIDIPRVLDLLVFGKKMRIDYILNAPGEEIWWRCFANPSNSQRNPHDYTYDVYVFPDQRRGWMIATGERFMQETVLDFMENPRITLERKPGRVI